MWSPWSRLRNTGSSTSSTRPSRRIHDRWIDTYTEVPASFLAGLQRSFEEEEARE